MKTILASLLPGLLLLPLYCFGGGGNMAVGARSMGLGHASSALRDGWALFNNIAGIASLRNSQSIASFQNLYSIPSLNRMGFAMIFPHKEVVFGTSFYKFGDPYYHEIKAAIGAAHQIRNVSLGIKLNYHQIGIDEVGVKRNLVLEFGGQTEITEKLFFAAHIYNLNQAKINREKEEFIPVIMKAGISYRSFEKLLMLIDVEKQIAFHPVLKAGIEYSIIEKIKLRAGVSLNPGINYFGVGFKDKKISVDYSMNAHRLLGISQELSITYILKRKDEK